MRPGSKRTAWTLGALSAAVAVLLGLTLHGLRASHERATSDRAGDRAGDGAAAAPSSSARRVVPPKPAEVPPWDVTPATATAQPAGTVPAWKVDAPRPQPWTPMPPPREPENPAVHRPPMVPAAP